MSESRRRPHDPTSEEFAVSWREQIPLRVMALLLEIITRFFDLVALLPRPKLWAPYLVCWWIELRQSPYRWPRGFEVTRLLNATGQAKRELVYGETPLATGIWLLVRAQAGRRSRLLDVGAGRGRMLLAARWLRAEARGIELLPSHVKPVAGVLSAVGAQLLEGDATQIDPTWATHVYLNWCGFSPATQAKVVENLRRCASGTRFIAVTRPIEHPEFAHISTHWALYTWGFERVWIQELRADKRGPLIVP